MRWLLLIPIMYAVAATWIVIRRRPRGGFRLAPHPGCVIQIDEDD